MTQSWRRLGSRKGAKGGMMEPQVYQFKILLVGIQPLIWRRFRVHSNVTFRQLHNIVQIVMGWENYHLYQFFWNYYRFTEQLMGADDKRSSHVLSEFVTQPGSILGYEYDFGDSWHHELLLEKALTTTRKPCPICTHGSRACPPEDCGGCLGIPGVGSGNESETGLCL